MRFCVEIQHRKIIIAKAHSAPKIIANAGSAKIIIAHASFVKTIIAYASCAEIINAKRIAIIFGPGNYRPCLSKTFVTREITYPLASLSLRCSTHWPDQNFGYRVQRKGVRRMR